MPGRTPLGRPYWLLWTATTISGLGGGMTTAAIPLLAAVYTHDPRWIATVMVATYLPALLFGLHSGAIADRSEPRVVMCAADGVRLVVVVAVSVAVWSGDGTLGWLVAAAFALGAAAILFENASATLIPALVPRERLGRANSWLLSTQTISIQFIGLPLGGVLFALAPSAPFAVDAATYAAAIALLLAMPLVGSRGGVARAGTRRTTLHEDVREGAVWLWRQPALRLIACVTASLNAAMAMGEASLVLYASEVLGLAEVGYTLLLSLLAAGGILGALVAGALRRGVGSAPTTVACLAVMAGALAVPGLTARLPVVVVALVLGGAASMAWNVTTVTLRQEIVPEGLLGRVTAAYRVLALGVVPPSAVLGGWLAHLFGLQVPWLAAGGVALAAGVLAAPGLLRADLDVVRGSSAPSQAATSPSTASRSTTT